MKVALLLTGQLRTHPMCKYVIKNCIIDRYDTDVFMSIDTLNDQQNEWRNKKEKTNDNQVLEAISWYQPVSYIVTNEQDHSVADGISERLLTFVDSWRLRLLFVQYANVKKVYKLLQEHIKLTDKTYDIVIRLRFDELMWNLDSSILHECLEKSEQEDSPFNQSMDIKYNSVNVEVLRALSKRFTIKLDPGHPNTIYTHGFGIVHGYPYVSDFFWIHGPDLINIFAGFHDEMSELLLDCAKTFFPNRGCLMEHVFFKFLFKYHIYLKKSIVYGLVIRELPVQESR